MTTLQDFDQTLRILNLQHVPEIARISRSGFKATRRKTFVETAQQIKRWDADPDTLGTFFAINRPADDYTTPPGGRVTKRVITHRCFVPIDIDAVRPETDGVKLMATDEELQHACRVALNVMDWLIGNGVPPTSMYLLCSGNGYQVMIRTDVEESPEVESIIRLLLNTIAEEFSNGHAKVEAFPDSTRLMRFPLTWNRKSDAPTDVRPHRRASAMLDHNELPIDEPLAVCPWDVIDWLAFAVAPIEAQQAEEAARQRAEDRKNNPQKYLTENPWERPDSFTFGWLQHPAEVFDELVMTRDPDCSPQRNVAEWLQLEHGYTYEGEYGDNILMNRPGCSQPRSLSVHENGGMYAISGHLADIWGRHWRSEKVKPYEFEVSQRFLDEHGDLAELTVDLKQEYEERFEAEGVGRRKLTAQEAFADCPIEPEPEPDDPIEDGGNPLLDGLYDYATLQSMHLKPAEPIIEGLVSDGQPLLIAGPAKSYKSTLMWDLIVSVSTGTPAFVTYRNGTPIGLKVRKKKKVLVYQVEGSLASHAEAIDDIKHQKRISHLTPDMLLQPYARIDIGTEKGRRKIFDAVRRTGAEIVVLDNLTSMMPSIDANSKEERHAALIALQNGLEKLGATYWAVAHFRKLQKGRHNPDAMPTLDDISGGGLAEAASNVILIDPPYRSVEDQSFLRLSCSSRELGLVERCWGLVLARSAADGCLDPYDDEAPQTVKLTDRGTRGYDLVTIQPWRKFKDVHGVRVAASEFEKQAEKTAAEIRREQPKHRSVLVEMVAEAVYSDPPRVGVPVSDIKRRFNCHKGESFQRRCLSRVKELTDNGWLRLIKQAGTLYLTFRDSAGPPASLAELAQRLGGDVDVSTLRTFEVSPEEIAEYEEIRETAKGEAAEWL
jgi:hypothetical protein